jgi:hypothetical protein
MTTAGQSDEAISATAMRQLLRDGTAVALLEDHFPVPAKLRGQWWHVPSGEREPDNYLPAPPAAAALYERLAARRRMAAGTTGHVGGTP